ncbi:MAG: response regulator [Nitrospinae bacterium]|nr:response regulator [Nitrospinota bacterium]
MFKNLKFRAKFLIVFLFIGLLPVLFSGWQDYRIARKDLELASFNHLTTIREIKKTQIKAYFNQIRNQVLTLAEDRMIIEAMRQFKEAFDGIDEDIGITEGQITEYRESVMKYYQTEFIPRLNKNIKLPKTAEEFWPSNDNAIILQYKYIAENPHPTGTKNELETIEDGSKYSMVHLRYHQILHHFQKQFGYKDIFLVDDQTGDIVYSVFKEVEFGTSLINGPYKDTNLAKVFQEASRTKSKDFVKMVDFAPHYPAYAAPQSFIASPVFDGNQKIGVLVFQMPLGEMNSVMTGNKEWEKIGLGKSGETYLVGSDHKMRSDSRFIIEHPDEYLARLEEQGVDKKVIEEMRAFSTTILLQEARTAAVEEALRGKTGAIIAEDYRGVLALSSFTPLGIPDVDWFLLAKIDESEAFALIHQLKKRLIFKLLGISVLVVAFGFLFSKALSDPIIQLIRGTEALGKGDLSRRVRAASRDEIGILASSFNKMAEDLQTTSVSKDYLDNLLRSLNEIMVVAHPPGNEETAELKNWLIKRTNMAAHRTLEYAEGELDGRPLSILFPEEEKVFHQFQKELKEQGLSAGMETDFLSKNGNKIPALCSAFMMRSQCGEFQGVVFVGTDITQLKQIQENLTVEKNKAEDATKLKDKFISLVAHDLKSPFTAIMGFLQIILNDSARPLHEEHREKFHRILASGKNMLHMIDELLKLSRFQTGILSPVRHFMDARVPIAFSMSSLHYLADKKGIELVNDVPKGTRIYADMDLFPGVIQNLLSNAIKFCRKDDKVTVFVPPGQSDTIAVKDTGTGIPGKFLPDLFKSDAKTSAIGTAGEKGTGLGLPMCHDIVAAHGGSIRVESEEGVGSVFYVQLPCIKPCILIVDDEPVIRELFKKHLSSMDVEIREAENGRDALAVLEKFEPHLIIADLMMPVMDGFELIERLRDLPKAKSTPIIVITNDALSETREKAFRLGADDFVGKAVAVEDLISRVKKYIL